MTPRRFPPPWSVEEQVAWRVVRDHTTDLSAHLATSSVLDPLQCLVLILGEGDETALQSRRQTRQQTTPQDGQDGRVPKRS